jgi:serine/threonine-protein kinase
MIGQTISHYKILEKLGSGGMGVVYTAEDTRLKRTVALKFLPPELTRDREARKRFVKEAQAASALEHSNICTIYEIDETKDGQMFIAMACYQGETVKEKIAKGPLDLEETVDIARQAAQGLVKAHGRGIVHRDIKPANIFVTQDNEVKIVDFGLAKLAGKTRLTKADTTLGTIGYMSPEQTRGEDVDHRSDIWALGVVLYEMVTGGLPFKGDHEQAIVYSIMNEDPEPLTSRRTGVPLELEAIVSKCLAKSPADRYQHADELIVDLNRQSKSMQIPYGSSLSHTAGLPQKRKLTNRWLGLTLVVVLAAAGAYALYSRLATTSMAPPESGKKMLVVLPFENLGPPEVEYFADGITEEITSRLAALSGLGVISRTSAFQYKAAKKSIKQIGAELGIDYVLEGTVRWDKPGQGESRVRVTPQLIRVTDDTHLWSDRYDRILRDIFSVQSDIATQVTEKLNVTLFEPERQALEAQPTSNMEAYQAYLRGLGYGGRQYSPETTRLAIEMFERAVALDPNFALAYVALAQEHSGIFGAGMERTQDHLVKAKAAVDRALEIQPELPEALLALGNYYYHCLRDYDRAQEIFDITGKHLPNKSELHLNVGWIRRRQGHWEEGMNYIKQAFELNPRDVTLCIEIGNTHLFLREYGEALAYYDRAIALAPEEAWSYAFKAVGCWFLSGDVKRARTVLETMPVTNEPLSQYIWFMQEVLERDYQAAQDRLVSISAESIELFGRWYAKAQLEGYVYKLLDEPERARVLFDSACVVLEREIAARPGDGRIHSSLGVVYSALGRREDAIREAKLAVEMIPVTLDALIGPSQIFHLSQAYVFLGEYEAALDQIEYLLAIPSLVSVSALRLDPRWDPLRGHPRFQRLLEKNAGAGP